MAEAIILPLATSILKKIASFTGDLALENVTTEFKGFKSVEEDLKAIAGDLESITSVLQDAEAKQYSNAAIKIWLRDLKSVVYDIDDLLDEVATDALQMSLGKGHPLGQLGYYLSLKSIVFCFELTRRINDVRLELEHIVLKKNTFGLIEYPFEASSVQRHVLDVCDYVNKLDIVGRDDAKTDIMSIVLGLGGERSLSVLPIFGKGGIGKTTLAKLVYAHVNEFDIKLWLDYLDLYRISQDIFIDATRESTPNYSLGQSAKAFQDVLNGKKYFLVLDDMRENYIRIWKELKSILDVGGQGSVILITTRVEKVASMTHTIKPYNLDNLPNPFCWSIFKNFAFADGEEEKYPKLSNIGKSIVEKCCGIPLVVQCLGSLLRCERDEKEWLQIDTNLNQLDGRYSTVNQLLAMGYDKLPYYLKSLFAHLSLYAKNTLYSPVVQSYYPNALGLLQPPDESYRNHNAFNELLSRFMFQDIKFNFNKTIDAFKIHDLLHDLGTDILGEELAVVTRKSNLSVPVSSRYIAWELDGLLDQEFPIKAMKARVFMFCYKMTKVVSQNFLKGIISNMPCLRILVLQCSQFEELPSSIGNLKHLRCLDLSGNPLIKSLPDTVCELLNLECLLLHGCDQLEELPSEIYKLINLILFTLTTRQSSLVGTKLNNLPSLRQMHFDGCSELVSLWDDDYAGRLTSIHNLEIFNSPKLTRLPDSMKLLVKLEELHISGCEELDLESGDALTGLQSLRTLEFTRIPRLTCLPNGMFSAASSLKHLYIDECNALAELPNWLGSFASLERLFIKNCPNLLSLPQGILHLNSLQYLDIYNCPHLSRRCAFPEGEDSYLMVYLYLDLHVPEIWLDGYPLRYMNTDPGRDLA